MNTIDLSRFNREGRQIWLEKESENIYQLKASEDFVLEHLGYAYEILDDDAEDYDLKDDDGKYKIQSIDPSGGPYLSLGTKIGELPINKFIIENGNIKLVLK